MGCLNLSGQPTASRQGALLPLLVCLVERCESRPSRVFALAARRSRRRSFRVPFITKYSRLPSRTLARGASKRDEWAAAAAYHHTSRGERRYGRELRFRHCSKSSLKTSIAAAPSAKLDCIKQQCSTARDNKRCTERQLSTPADAQQRITKNAAPHPPGTAPRRSRIPRAPRGARVPGGDRSLRPTCGSINTADLL